MKIIRFFTLTAFLCFYLLQVAPAQNKKLDKALSKADGYYKAGSFSKALKTLSKFKSGALKISSQNNYIAAYYLREARLNLAMGMPAEFEISLGNVLSSSQAVFGESSTSFANTLLEVGGM